MQLLVTSLRIMLVVAATIAVLAWFTKRDFVGLVLVLAVIAIALMAFVT